MDFSPLPLEDCNISEFSDLQPPTEREKYRKGRRGNVCGHGRGDAGVRERTTRKLAREIRATNERAWLHQISEANKRKEKQDLKRQIVDQVTDDWGSITLV